MCNMTLHCIPIQLANGSVVYSEGIGTVQFNPVVHGQEMAKLEFTNVLSWGERCGQGGTRFPGPHQFWLLDPGLLPPGRCQTHPEVCLCPCPWVQLLNVPYSE